MKGIGGGKSGGVMMIGVRKEIGGVGARNAGRQANSTGMIPKSSMVTAEECMAAAEHMDGSMGRLGRKAQDIGEQATCVFCGRVCFCFFLFLLGCFFHFFFARGGARMMQVSGNKVFVLNSDRTVIQMRDRNGTLLRCRSPPVFGTMAVWSNKLFYAGLDESHIVLHVLRTRDCSLSWRRCHARLRGGLRARFLVDHVTLAVNADRLFFSDMTEGVVCAFSHLGDLVKGFSLRVLTPFALATADDALVVSHQIQSGHGYNFCVSVYACVDGTWLRQITREEFMFATCLFANDGSLVLHTVTDGCVLHTISNDTGATIHKQTIPDSFHVAAVPGEDELLGYSPASSKTTRLSVRKPPC